MLWGGLLRVVFAALLWWVGTRLIRKILGLSLKPKMQLPVDRTMRRFLLNATRTALYALLVLAVIVVLGIPMASVTAVVASTGVTLGLAMQGALSNLAGGIMLTLTHPFAIGDYIEAAQVGGTVDEIGLFYTVLVGIDNKKITVPNGSLMNANITNYSSMAKRRLDLTFLVGRGEDPERVKEILRTAIAAESAVLQPPEAVAAPFVALTELQEKGLLFTIRVWCKNPDYWNLNFALTERIAKAFQQEHISPPAQPYRAVAEKEER
jgi:putative small-conductance mechanosensitive channel